MKNKDWHTLQTEFNDDQSGGGGGAAHWSEPADPNADAQFQQLQSGQGSQQLNNSDDQQQQQQQQQTDPNQQQGNQSQQSQQSQQADPAQMAAMFAQALKDAGIGQQQQQQQKPKDLTDEEFAKLTHRYTIPADAITKLWQLPADLDAEAAKTWVAERQGFLQQLVDGAVKHATTVSRLASMSDMQALQQTLQPVLAERAQAQQERTYSNIIGGNAVLKALQPQAAKTIVVHAVNALRSEGFQPKNEQEAVQAIYQRIEALGKISNPNFTLSLQSGGGGGAGRGAGMGSAVNGGGGSGAHGGKQATRAKNPAMDLYE